MSPIPERVKLTLPPQNETESKRLRRSLIRYEKLQERGERGQQKEGLLTVKGFHLTYTDPDLDNLKAFLVFLGVSSFAEDTKPTHR